MTDDRQGSGPTESTEHHGLPARTQASPPAIPDNESSLAFSTGSGPNQAFMSLEAWKQLTESQQNLVVARFAAGGDIPTPVIVEVLDQFQRYRTTRMYAACGTAVMMSGVALSPFAAAVGLPVAILGGFSLIYGVVGHLKGNPEQLAVLTKAFGNIAGIGKEKIDIDTPDADKN